MKLRPTRIEGNESMRKLIYFHGFDSSGEGGTVRTLKELLPDWTVIAPDIPVDPKEALPFLKELCQKEQPDVIVGTSMGGMYAQQMHGFKRICVNPAFDISKHKDILKEGTFEFFNPRKDGEKTFTITQDIIQHFAEMEAHQFDGYSKKEIRDVYGLFGSDDTVVNNLDLFKHYYEEAYIFNGGHRLSRESIKGYLIDLIKVAIQGGWYKPYGFKTYSAWPKLYPQETRPSPEDILTTEELNTMSSIIKKRENMAESEFRKEILKGIEHKYAWVADFYRPSTGHRWTEFSFTEPFGERGDEYDNDLAEIERKRVVRLRDVPTAYFKTIEPRTIY